MLWLAGLMGLVGVGAASVAYVQLQEEPEEDNEYPELTDENSVDLLNEISGLNDVPPEHDEMLSVTGFDDELSEKPMDEISNIFGDDGQSQSPSYSQGGGNMLSDWVQNSDNESRALDDNAFSIDTEDATFLEEGPSNTTGTDVFQDMFSNALSGVQGTEEPDNFAQDESEPLTLTESQVMDQALDGLRADALVGDWISQGGASEILDYETGRESLMLVWDDMADGASEPNVGVTEDPDDPEVMHVMMNGKSVAEIYGDPYLDASDVTIIPLSSALIAGLEPA